jgi:hypothetical protein
MSNAAIYRSAQIAFSWIYKQKSYLTKKLIAVRQLLLLRHQQYVNCRRCIVLKNRFTYTNSNMPIFNTGYQHSFTVQYTYTAE